MRKKSFLTLTLIFLFMYLLNYLHPMSFGDDYVYSFIWQGHSMETPLTEDAVRVLSWRDLFISQWSHYFTWGGRAVGHTFAQFFLWMGKDVFNLFNALSCVVLIAEIYWCSNKGKLNLDFNQGRICWIFFAIWAFSSGFNQIFLWLTGSCVYLWTEVALLGFLLPYIKKYYAFQEKKGTNCLFAIIMFLGGLISGCGNENCVCWIILALLWFLFSLRNYPGKELWMYTGVAGLILGYSLLILSPGNMVRLYAEHGSSWFTIRVLKDNLHTFIVVLTFQLILWHFCLRSLYKLAKQESKKQVIQKDIVFVKLLCIASLGMSAVMLFTPYFPTRSGFPGTLQLVIAGAILLRLQKETKIELISTTVRKCLFLTGVLYFVMTSSVTIRHSYNMKMQMDNLINTVKQTERVTANTILTVKPFKDSSFLEDLLSGYHLSYFCLADDVNSWGNVAFARYYGIKGIRMVNDKNKSDNESSNNIFR